MIAPIEKSYQIKNESRTISMNHKRADTLYDEHLAEIGNGVLRKIKGVSVSDIQDVLRNEHYHNKTFRVNHIERQFGF